MGGYVELHCHSNFSLLDGASHPEELIARAKELGMFALAITDHDGLYGAVRFHKAARESGIMPIIGAEITLEDGSHLTLISENKAGYSNLCRLISYSHSKGGKTSASIDLPKLASFSSGLICLSGCRNGEICKLILEEKEEDAMVAAQKYLELFGRGNFFIELQHHYLPDDNRLCQKLISIAKKLDVDYVATNNVHYTIPARHRLHDVLTCIKNRTTLDKSSKLRRSNFEYSLKSHEEMGRLFAGYPEAINNTSSIAERCLVELKFDEYRCPDFPLPSGETSMSYLTKLCYAGAEERYKRMTEVVRRQLEHELGVIDRMSLAGYFLIVWDIVRYARENGIPARGRGSAADSIVAYVLGITRVDPIRYNLLFERFLNEGMKGTPDIDIDVSTNHREKLIQYVYKKYGHVYTAMVSNVVTFQARNAVRDVGKVMGIPSHVIDRLAKSLDSYSASSVKAEIAKLDEFKNNNSLPWQLYISLCQEIADFPRHLSIHVGGMIVSSCPLVDIVPLEPATAPGRIVTQWNKDDIEEVGLIKVDLLGLRMLSLIHDAVDLIEKHHGTKLNLDAIPLDDTAVFDMLCRADTVGVFQVESRAQMQTLPKTKPRCLNDLVIEVAIVRPGPLQGNMVHPYLRRRQGKEKVTYLHTKLKPILEETLGVILFQEQVIRIAVDIAGFTPAEADRLRRAMGKQRSKEEMEEIRQRFVSGAGEKKTNRITANRIFDQIASFASFGFCKSHAAAFARTCYESAYLKAYYPAEFYCALLNNQPMGFYSPEVIVNDAKRHGIGVVPVDINRSDLICTVEGGKIRLGFRYVKEVGDAIATKIVKVGQEGIFRSFDDFYLRVRPSREAVENLILAGAFDAFGLGKRRLLWDLGLIMKREPGELPLVTDKREVSLPEMSSIEETIAEYRVQGFSAKYHPMQVLRQQISRDGLLKSSEIAGLFSNTNVRTAGYVVTRQRPATAKGAVFLTLEDETGMINVIVKPQVYAKYRQVIKLEPLVVVEGKLQKRDGIVNIVAERLMPLRQERQRQNSLYPSLSSATSCSQEIETSEFVSACLYHEHF
jgi:error-prone DNA polymerase